MVPPEIVPVQARSPLLLVIVQPVDPLPPAKSISPEGLLMVSPVVQASAPDFYARLSGPYAG